MMGGYPMQQWGPNDSEGWALGVQNLGSVSEELLLKLAPTKDDLKTASRCLTELLKLAHELGSDWRARPFGSLASGFHTRFSDLDVTCFQEGVEASEQMPAATVLQQFLPLMQQHGSFETIEVISSARIPILKVKYDRKLEVDISFQNIDPFPNTQLLKAYAKLSTTVRQLVTLIKLWAKAEGVCGAPDRHLSSYSFTLLAIYFLQVDPMVKLPCFPTDQFNGEKDLPPEAGVDWQCPLTLPVLIARFFEFFATQYSWGYEVISVRTGQRLYAGDPAYSALSCSEGTTLPHIEDPFLHKRNLNCVLGWEQASLLHNKICYTAKAIQMGSAPFGFVTALGWFQEVGSDSLREAGDWGDHGAAGPSKSSAGGDNPQSGTAARAQGILSQPKVPGRQQGQTQKEPKQPKAKQAVAKAKAPAAKAPAAPRQPLVVVKPPAPQDIPMTSLCAGMTWSL